MATEVFLRDVEESDLPIFFDQQLDVEAARMAAFPSRDREAFMSHWTKSMANKTAALQTNISDGSVAGNIACWQQSDERLVGYWLGREYWGKGVATAALSLLLVHVTIRPLVARLFTLVTDDVVFLNSGQSPSWREEFSTNFLAAHQHVRIRCVSELEEVVVVGEVAYTRSGTRCL